MEEYLQLIAQFGFPIAMCCWFMFRQEKVIEKFRCVIEKNTEVIERLNDLVTKLSSKR